MGKKTSIYLPDYVAEALKENGESPSVLIRRGIGVRPLLTEGPDGERTWITRWFCAVPEEGQRFKVLHDEWHDEPWQGCNGNIPCREIYEIEVTGAPA